MVPDRLCPLCGHSQSVTLFAESNIDQQRLDRFSFASRKSPEYMHLRLLSCANCDLVFASAMPDSAQLHAAYEAAAFDSAAEAAAAASTYARLLAPVLRQLPDRTGALDIGTGDGAFLHKLLAWNFDGVRGIEPSSAPLEAASPDVRALIEQGLFEPGRFAAESCSLVTCFQTIEHVVDPLGLCREAVRLLKPGGVLCVVGHNRRAMSARLLGRKSPIFDIEHLQLFSTQSFLRLLTAAGLHSIDVAPFWNRYALSYWTRLLPLPVPVKGVLEKALSITGFGRLPLALPAGNLVAIGFKANERHSGAVESPAAQPSMPQRTG